MKLIHAATAAGAVIAMAFAVNSYAQASAPTDAAMTASAPASKTANRALAKKVRHELARTKGLDPTHIYVKVVGGAVYLTGSCASQQEIDLAGGAAQKVDGVTSVSNKLSVKTPQ